MLFYVTFIDFGAFYAKGVHKKIQGQIGAMRQSFEKAYYTGWSYPKAILMSEGEVIETEPAITRKDYMDVLMSWFQRYYVTQVYMRYSSTNKWFIELLKYLQIHEIKTVLEITTYPHDIESAEGINKLENACYNKEINQYIERIATYSSHKEIWGLSCFKLLNGINIEDNPISKRVREEKRIVMIAASTMQYWHGYERLLEGMYHYKKEKGEYDFIIKFIGTGPEEKIYKELVNKYDLQSQAEFLGKIEASEKKRFDEQYDASDIAVGTLGMYRADISEGSPIKGAEYCARGIPFICGYRDLRFPPDWDFVLNVPNNSEPIDMNQVTAFYERVTAKEHYKELMREYAEKNLTWDKIMEPVIDYLKA